MACVAWLVVIVSSTAVLVENGTGPPSATPTTSDAGKRLNRPLGAAASLGGLGAGIARSTGLASAKMFRRGCTQAGGITLRLLGPKTNVVPSSAEHPRFYRYSIVARNYRRTPARGAITVSSTSPVYRGDGSRPQRRSTHAGRLKFFPRVALSAGGRAEFGIKIRFVSDVGGVPLTYSQVDYAFYRRQRNGSLAYAAACLMSETITYAGG